LQKYKTLQVNSKNCFIYDKSPDILFFCHFVCEFRLKRLYRYLYLQDFDVFLKKLSPMRYFFLIIFTFFSVSMFSQPWMYSISRQKATKEPNFYEVQKAFYDYWEDRPVEKGKGFKQFKRWEYFMEPRVYPTGEIQAVDFQDEMLNSLNGQHNLQQQANWVFIGPNIVPTDINNNKPGGIGRINCIAFHPTDSNIIWVGAPTGGAWKSSDNGLSWTTSTDQLAAIGISDIAINPANPSVIYLATGDGNSGSGNNYGVGILKSTNGGITWQATSVSRQQSEMVSFRKIVFNPANATIMLAVGNKGIYRTVDGWSTHTVIRTGNYKDIEFHPENPSIMYATSYSNSGAAKIYKSTDAGSSFSESMTGMVVSGKVNRIEIAVTPANPAVVYAVCSDVSSDGFYALYKSVNSGASWSLVYDNSKLNLLGWSATGNDDGGQGWYDLAIAVSPASENEVYVGGVNVWRSTDGGKNWKIAGLWYHGGGAAYVHADQHALVYSPHNPRALYSGNDGGIYKTYNKGGIWTDLSNGLGILQVYRMSSNVKNPALILAGTQDNGTVMKSGNTWKEVLGGDGMECLFDYDNENVLYGTLYYGEIRKSINGGMSFEVVMPDESLAGAWITPVTMHPKFPNIIYLGYQKVYKTINGGDSWTQLAPFPSGSGNIRLIEVSQQNDKVIYAATINTIFRTTDGGKTWNNITPGLPDNAITALAISETDAMKIWVTLSGYSSGNKVYSSINGGTNWSNYSEGLPNLPVNCIVYQKNSHKILYAGTDIGVYYRDATMTQWEKYGDNLPNVIIYDLEIIYSKKKLRVATHGRGIWETDLYENTSAKYVDFIISAPVVCVNAQVEIKDYSKGNFETISWNFGSGATPSTGLGTGPHYVTYSTLGEKTITISGTSGGNPYTEIKQKIVNVAEEIDFIVSPEISYTCNDNEVVLYASGGYDFSWGPSTFLSSTVGERVVSMANENIKYTVKATSGSCSLEKTTSIMVVSNDNICDAILLNEGYNGPFTNKCASKQENEPVPPKGSAGDGCETQDGWCLGENRIDNSVWFKFIAPPGGIVSIQTDGFDNQIAVYSAITCNGLLNGNYILLAANDDYPGKADYSANIYEINGLIPGNTYWLQVDGSYGGVTGVFSVTLNYHRLSSNRVLTEDNNRIKIYPNPNDGSFTLDYYLDNAEDFEVIIFSLSGRQEYRRMIHRSFAEGSEKFDINLQPGIYMIEIRGTVTLMHYKFSVK
jgi:photosystem II stability/assembly factor-like uncharacterized protein